MADNRLLHSGQLVGAEIALVLLAFGVGTGTALTLAVGVLLAVPLLVLSLGRFRGRWLYGWTALGLSYATRRRRLRRAGAANPELFGLLAPGGRLAQAESDTGPVGVLHDAEGLVAVLDIGDPGTLLTGTALTLPPPQALFGPAGADAPALVVQVLVQARPAPGPGRGNGVPASSYRQLTEGTVPASLRILVAIRVSAHPGTTPSELTPVLLGAVRRTRARLARDGLTAQVLPPAALARALTDLAPHRAGLPVREGWGGLQLGGRHQAVFHPQLPPVVAPDLLTRLLAVPAGEVTVAFTAQRPPTQPASTDPAGAAEPPDGTGLLTVRLAAPDPSWLALAQRELERLCASLGGHAGRADGRQLPGLVCTLPLASRAPEPTTAPAPTPAGGLGSNGTGVSTNGTSVGTNGTGLSGNGTSVGSNGGSGRLTVPAAGLMLGRNRHGQPVTVHLLRADPTRAMLIGGGRAAATVVLRALALGTQVVVQSGRPESWDHLLRGVAGPTDAVALAPPGTSFNLPAASATTPQLVVLDVGPVPADPVPPGPWRTTLVVRDDVSTVDLDALGRADLVILQPLRPGEAELAGAVLGLGEGHAWLTRIRDDMVGLVSRRTVRWAQLCATPVEQQVIGAVTRVLAS